MKTINAENCKWNGYIRVKIYFKKRQKNIKLTREKRMHSVRNIHGDFPRVKRNGKDSCKMLKRIPPNKQINTYLEFSSRENIPKVKAI